MSMWFYISLESSLSSETVEVYLGHEIFMAEGRLASVWESLCVVEKHFSDRVDDTFTTRSTNVNYNLLYIDVWKLGKEKYNWKVYLWKNYMWKRTCI